MPELKVVMLTSYSDDEALFDAIMAGASGYLLKQIRARDLVAALESVGRGESLLDPAVTQRVLDRLRDGGASEPAELRSRTRITPEQEIRVALVEEDRPRGAGLQSAARDRADGRSGGRSMHASPRRAPLAQQRVAGHGAVVRTRAGELALRHHVPDARRV